MHSEEGYAAALRYREQRLREGWRAVGRKIGFTNRGIWPRYGVHQPIWGTVFDRTLVFADSGNCTLALAGLAQPRIEPEICFRLKSTPRSAGVDELIACIEWVAHAIEIVQCDLPGWRTSLAHSTAANGLHGRLIVGAPLAVERLPQLARLLPEVRLELCRDGVVVEHGRGANVLDSPLLALGHLVGLLAAQPEAPALAPGEIVSTGTLTDAHPVAAGERWSTRITGLPLDGLSVLFS